MGPTIMVRQAIAAEPMAAGEPILRGHEEHEEACQNDIRRGENHPQDLLNDQILKVAGVVQKFAEGTQLRPALFWDDKDKASTVATMAIMMATMPIAPRFAVVLIK